MDTEYLSLSHGDMADESGSVKDAQGWDPDDPMMEKKAYVLNSQKTSS